EEALRESETRYRSMIEATFDGVAIHQDGVMVDVNQGFCKMFGCERSEAIGRSVLDFIAEEAREAVLRNVRAGLQQPYEAVGVRRHGSRFDVEIVGRTYGPTGKGMGVAALRDITQRKVAERQRDLFAQTEKLRAIGQTASGVAHDLNQFLGLIVGHSELALTALSETGPDGETLPESLRIIHQAAMDGADT